MLIIRAYTVLDSLVTEVSCLNHGDDGNPAGHLLFRVSTRHQPANVLEALGVVADEVGEMVFSGDHLDLGVTDDCWG